MSKLLLLSLAPVLFGCASAPQSHEITKSYPYQKGYEDVWTAVIQTFADLNLPISNMEKASGLIVTDWIDMKGEDAKNSGACDCGKPGITTKEATQGKFNIFVKHGAASDSTNTMLTVNTLFRQYRTFGSEGSWVNCTSTGILESKLHSMVIQNLK